MPEAFDDVGREEARSRKALGKAVNRAVKARAKQSGWKVAQGVLFRDLDGWFVSASPAVWVGRRRSMIEIRCKPMALDPVFWEVVKAESNNAMPLSFRSSGSWTCRVPACSEADLIEADADPLFIADQALQWANAQLGQFKTWSLEHFLGTLQSHPRASAYLATIITTQLLLGDYAGAAEHCKAAQLRGDACGYGISSESGPSLDFPALALAWIARKRREFH